MGIAPFKKILPIRKEAGSSSNYHGLKKGQTSRNFNLLSILVGCGVHQFLCHRWSKVIEKNIFKKIPSLRGSFYIHQFSPVVQAVCSFRVKHDFWTKKHALSSSGPGYFIPKDARAGKKVSAITEKSSDDRICTQILPKILPKNTWENLMNIHKAHLNLTPERTSPISTPFWIDVVLWIVQVRL